MIDFKDEMDSTNTIALGRVALEVKPCFTIEVRLPGEDWFPIALVSNADRIMSGVSEKHNIHVSLIMGDNTLLTSSLNGEQLSDFVLRYPTPVKTSKQKQVLLKPKDIKGKRLRKGDKAAKPFYLSHQTNDKKTY